VVTERSFCDNLPVRLLFFPASRYLLLKPIKVLNLHRFGWGLVD